MGKLALTDILVAGLDFTINYDLKYRMGREGWLFLYGSSATCCPRCQRRHEPCKRHST